jgi:hypothetical protein
MSEYRWQCDRCETSCVDTSRTGVELFSYHHYKLVHPLYALDEVTDGRCADHSAEAAPARARCTS